MAPPQSEMVVRDFIYMDVDRLRSIMAQCDKGLSETLTEGTLSSDSASLKGEAGVVGVAKVTSQYEYLYSDEVKVTKTLHDHIYTMVENYLIKHKLLIKLPDTQGIDALNVREKITDTSFVLIAGKVRIDDTSQITSLMVPGMKYMQLMTASGLGQSGQGNKTPTKEIVSQPFDLMNEQTIGTFAGLFQALYKERVTITSKVYEDSDIEFVGTLDKEKLRDNISNIIFKYTTAPDSNWVIFGQICAIPKPKVAIEKIDQKSEGFDLSQVFESVRDLEFLSAQNVKYPQISITPIAIYREARTKTIQALEDATSNDIIRGDVNNVGPSNKSGLSKLLFWRKK